MIRRHRHGRPPSFSSRMVVLPQRRDSSRLSPLVMNNPVNQSAHWSQDAYFLQDLVSLYPLPQVIRCASRLIKGEDQRLPVNVHVPMLLCSGRSAKKLLAKHVGKDARTHHLEETDDTIAIPSDYDGHFLRLQARTTKDNSVVRSLWSIAQSEVPAFVNFTPTISFTPTTDKTTTFRSSNNILNGDGNNNKTSNNVLNGDNNRTSNTVSNGDGNNTSNNVSNGGNNNNTSSNVLNGDGNNNAVNKDGDAVSKGSSGGSKKGSEQTVHTGNGHQKRNIHPPGSVFVISGTAKGVVKDKKGSRDLVLLRCSDEDGHEVLVPTDQPGMFIEVETPPPGESKLSMLSHDLISANRYPGLVRYVYGGNAPRLSPCSNMFTLIDSFEENSVIGCLLYPDHALLIELPMTSSLTFQVAQNRDEVMAMPLTRHAISVVDKRKDTFIKDLKLKCKFVHRVNSDNANDADDDMPSATVRTRMYANEAFFYM